MLEIAFFIALFYMVSESICQEKRTLHVDCNGRLIDAEMMNEYNSLMKMIEHCKTVAEADRAFFETEYFQMKWGSNEWYQILYGNYCEKHNKLLIECCT